MKKVEIETPKFETVQVGVNVEIKWETSDGQQFNDERSADFHEFYQCKIKQRGHHLPVSKLEVFDFTCKEDLERYEKDYMYNDHIKKYDKNSMVFPNTYVMYEDYETDEDDYNEEWGIYGTRDLVYFVPLEEYKKLLIKAAKELS